MSTARGMIGLVGVLGIGGLLADFVVWETARQHMKNPAWPRHAKFHNAQTILLGLAPGGLTVILVCTPTGATLPRLCEAAATGSFYWLSMLLAPLFPGTAWSDPQFRPVNRPAQGMPPQQILAIVVVFLLIFALVLALRANPA